MLAFKKTIPKVYTQLSRPCTQFIRLNSTTPNDSKPQFQGILDVLGLQSTDGTLEPKTNNVGTTTNNINNTFDFPSFGNSLNSLSQTPHQIHINASPNNTIITLTRPNGCPLVTTSGGSAGFKKAARSGYEAAHQAAMQLLEKMNAKNLQVPNVHFVLKGFGPGRDAAFKALVSGSSWNVKRITDATPIPFGGCRPKKARRL